MLLLELLKHRSHACLEPGIKAARAACTACAAVLRGVAVLHGIAILHGLAAHSCGTAALPLLRLGALLQLLQGRCR